MSLLREKTHLVTIMPIRSKRTAQATVIPTTAESAYGSPPRGREAEKNYRCGNKCMQVQHTYHNDFKYILCITYILPCEIQSITVVAFWAVITVGMLSATLVAKVLVWAAAIIDAAVEVLVTKVLAGIVGVVIASALKLALPASYSVPVDVTVDFSVYPLAGAMPGVLTGICIEVLADVNTNAFAVVMTALEFPVSTPSEEFGR